MGNCEQICKEPGPPSPPPAGQNIVELAVSVPDLSTLVTALQVRARTASFYSTTGPTTTQRNIQGPKNPAGIVFSDYT